SKQRKRRLMTATLPRAETSDVARHIARVAARLFATQGYDATSVRTIVEEAGVTKPTLYYYFGSKEGLAQALLSVRRAELDERLRSIVEMTDDAVVMLEQTFEAHFAFSREDPERARFFLALFFGPLDASLKEHMARVKGGMRCSMDEAARRAA